MSANYNTSLLRQLQAPLLAALRKMEEDVGQVAAGQRRPEDLDVSTQAHEVASSLGMIGRQAVARLAQAIGAGAGMLSSPHSHGWTQARTLEVAQSLHALIRAFTAHIQDMVESGADLHVRLWPLWADLAQATESAVPAVEDLFEVDPDFEDVAFTPRPLPHLQQVVPPAYDRLVAATGLVEVARSREEIEGALQKALEVFTQLYGLRHRRAYQLYWLIVRARLSAGLLRGEDLLAQRAQWLALLRDAGIQVRKFGQDHRRLSPDKLRSALGPLLDPWPQEWAVAHPVLAELDRRLGLSVFWQAVAEIRQETSTGAAAQFSLRQKELEKLAHQVHSSWNKAVAATVDMRRPAAANFLKALGALLDKSDWFPGVITDPLFEAFRQMGNELAVRVKEKDMAPVQDALALEAAAAILMIEEIIERRVRWSKELEDRIRAQAARLALAVEGRHADLQAQPMLQWDRRWRARQVDKAVRQAMGQALVHADIIEKSLADLFRGEDEDEIHARLDEFQDRCRVMSRVLMTLRQPLAARMAEGLRDQIAQLSRSPDSPTPDTQVEQLATVLASLSRFLHASRNADVDAPSLLAPGFNALWGPDAYAQALADQADQPAEEPDPNQESATVSDDGSVPESTSPAIDPDQTPPRDLRAQLLGSGTWDEPADASILPVFLEEADEALAEVALQRSLLLSSPRDQAAWESLRRQFHTLKGSGRIAGLPALGEIAWWVEERVNEALVANEFYGPDLDRAIGLVAGRLAGWYGQLARSEQGLIQAGDIRQELDDAPVLLSPPASAAPAPSAPAPAPMSEEDIQGAWAGSPPAPEPGPEPELAPALALESPAAPPAPPVAQEPVRSPLGELDGQMSEVVRQEAEAKADDLASVLIQFEMNGKWDWPRFHLAVHTLAALFVQAGYAPASLEVRVAKVLEAVSTEWLEAGTDKGDPPDSVIQACEWLRKAAVFLADGRQPAPADGGPWVADFRDLAQPVIAAADSIAQPPAPSSQGESLAHEEAADADEWTLNLGDGMDQELDPALQSHDAEEIGPQPALETEPALAQEPSSEPDSASPPVTAPESAPEPDPIVEPESDLEVAPPTELTTEPAAIAEPESGLDVGPATAPVPLQEDPEGSDRDRAWEEVFDAIDKIQAAFALLSHALVKLNDQDYRDR